MENIINTSCYKGTQTKQHTTQLNTQHNKKQKKKEQ